LHCRARCYRRTKTTPDAAVTLAADAGGAAGAGTTPAMIGFAANLTVSSE